MRSLSSKEASMRSLFSNGSMRSFSLNLLSVTNDHFARCSHAVLLVAVRIGRADERFFGIACDRRSAQRTRYLHCHRRRLSRKS
jgi:hypothetical protein